MNISLRSNTRATGDKTLLDGSSIWIMVNEQIRLLDLKGNAVARNLGWCSKPYDDVPEEEQVTILCR
ncbi:hypothetical protein TNCT_123111 [Trichonephila clavata]|uniref:Uncharacterized protein n=1 Tax=Trichonephila clavata TaxID=2740835 RepID=A0A8X6LVU1_TRICU|nr:hypothetical protein TNCT_123111 [Trichonephila clavata]